MLYYDVTDVIFGDYYYSEDYTISVISNAISITKIKDFYDVVNGITGHKKTIPSPLKSQYFLKNYDLSRCDFASLPVVGLDIDNINNIKYAKIVYKNCIVNNHNINEVLEFYNIHLESCITL